MIMWILLAVFAYVLIGLTNLYISKTILESLKEKKFSDIQKRGKVLLGICTPAVFEGMRTEPDKKLGFLPEVLHHGHWRPLSIIDHIVFTILWPLHFLAKFLLHIYLFFTLINEWNDSISKSGNRYLAQSKLEKFFTAPPIPKVVKIQKVQQLQKDEVPRTRVAKIEELLKEEERIREERILLEAAEETEDSVPFRGRQV